MTTQIIEHDVLSDEAILHTFDSIEYDESPADPDHRTHIVNPPNNPHIWQPGMEAQDVVDIARTTGQEITALCGYTWVPKRDPEKFDICDACMKIAGDIMREMGE